MVISLNGKKTELPEALTVQAFVQSKGLPAGATIIELNGVVLPAERWAETSLKANDRLEVVRYVGGGQ